MYEVINERVIGRAAEVAAEAPLGSTTTIYERKTSDGRIFSKIRKKQSLCRMCA
jgi:hypothetical protein